MGSAEKPRAAQITLGDGVTEELLVTPVEPNLYRLEESSLVDEVQSHDVREAKTLSDGGLRLVRVATIRIETASCVLPENVFESLVLQALLDRVMSIGGNWERMLGGVLTATFRGASNRGCLKAFLSTFPIPGYGS